MSRISRKNSFGKVVFPFLVGNFMSQDGNCFFGRHFVIVYPIFYFFAVFWFFWITLSVACISLSNSFGKVLSWVRVHMDPPWPLTGVHYTMTTKVLTYLSKCHSNLTILTYLSKCHSSWTVLKYLSKCHSNWTILTYLSKCHSNWTILTYLSKCHSNWTILTYLSKCHSNWTIAQCSNITISVQEGAVLQWTQLWCSMNGPLLRSGRPEAKDLL